MQNHNLGKAIAISLVFIIISFLAQSALSEVDSKYTQAWQHVAVKRVLDMPLGAEEAIIWHLDYSDFAVRLPGCLMVLDYDNETPVPQWETYQKPELGLIESLFTGVIDLEEIKNERVMFLFSHNHPAEKFKKLLSWKDTIKDVKFLITQDDYLAHEKEILELQEKEKDDVTKKSVESVIKIIEPNHDYIVYGNAIHVKKQKAILNGDKKILYPGVEFLIDTNNGLTIYHSGSLMCRQCFGDLHDKINKRKLCLDESAEGLKTRIIDANTKKIRIVDGRTVAVLSGDYNDEWPTKTAGVCRLALAVYSDPQVPLGYIYMYVSVGPQAKDVGQLMGGSFIDVGCTHADYVRIKAHEKAHFLERDKFYNDRNPACDEKIGDQLHLEWVTKEINEYFGEMEGNREVIESLMNADINRYTDYFIKGNEYSKLGMEGEEIDKKINQRLHGGDIEEVACGVPSFVRGETFYFTTRADWWEPHPKFMDVLFGGYSDPNGSPTFTNTTIPWKAFKECGYNMVTGKGLSEYW